MHVQHLFPFICWWGFWLFLCPVYSKQCCNEHTVHVSSGLWFSQDMCPGVGFLGHMVVLFLVFFFFFLNKLHAVLHSDCINLHSHQQCKKVGFSPHSLQHLWFVNVLMMAILTDVRCYYIDLYLSTISDGHILMCPLAIYVFFGKMPIQVFHPFFYWVF